MNFKNKRYICIIFFCMYLLISNNIAKASVSNNKNVLFISSNSPFFATFYEQLIGIKENLIEDCNFYVKSMIADLDEDKRSDDEFYEIIKNKLKDTNIDVVLLSNKPALDFALKYKDDLFKNIPIVFFGIKDVNLAITASKIENFYGLSESPSILENIEFIKKAHNPKRIVIIGVERLSKDDYKTCINYLKNKYENIDFEYISFNELATKLSYDETINKIDELEFLKKEDVLLATYSFKNDIRENINFKLMREFLDYIDNIPKYTTIDNLFGENFIGGIQKSNYDHAKKATEIVNALLNNEKVDKKYISFNEVNTPIFDYKKLKKYDVDLNLIPKNAIVLNSPKNFIVENSVLILVIIILIIIFVLLGVILKVRYNIKNDYKKELIRAKKEAEAYNKSKTYFISNISHELRTPINIILSSIELINFKCNTMEINDNTINNNVAMVRKNCYRQLRTINNIIDIVKTESGDNKLNLENMEIVSFIEDIVLSTTTYMQNKELEIIFDTTDEEIYMAIDNAKIKRVVLNLISNAIKFSEIKSEILVNIYNSNNELKISVKDFGIGIHQSDINKIFKSFSQLDESMTRENEGNGIGLSIVDKFVKLHNGRINVISSLGSGSLFEVILPIKVLSDKNDFENNNINKAIEIDNIEIELSDIFI